MSNLTDIFNSIKNYTIDFQKEAVESGYSEECRTKLEKILIGINQAEILIEEHRTRDQLIDNLYLSIGSKLNTTFDLHELMGVIVDSLEKLIGFNAAGVFLLNLGSGEIESDFIRGYQFDQTTKIRQKVGEGILGMVIESGKSINVGDVSKNPRYVDARPQTRSEMAVPLVSQGNIIGCINLESDELDFFSDESLTLLETFATQASLALERARFQAQLLEKKILEEELSIARKIQMSLLPVKTPDFPGFEMAGLNLPSRHVGGDYYDFFQMLNGSLGVAIADVAGKGIGAALTMSGFRAALRSEIRHGFQSAKLMHKVNHFVYESTESSGFITAFVALFEGDCLKYINAGHNPPILLRENGDHELLECGGIVLGFQEEQEFDEGIAQFNIGDTVLLYTDGATEAMNSNDVEFGIENLLAVMKDNATVKIKDRLRAIHRKIVQYSGEYISRDDLTLVMIKRI